jgi:hypothetical protein
MPNVRAIAAEAAEFDIVGVLASADLEQTDEFATSASISSAATLLVLMASPRAVSDGGLTNLSSLLCV